MGIPRKGGQFLAVIYSNIVTLNTKLFTKYVKRHPSKKINTKKLPEKLLDASESHKTSAGLSVRAYFPQFSDWWDTYFGHSQESPGTIQSKDRGQMESPS